MNKFLYAASLIGVGLTLEAFMLTHNMGVLPFIFIMIVCAYVNYKD